MDIESYNVLVKIESDLIKTLNQITQKSFDIKIERAKVERKLEKIKLELSAYKGHPLEIITNKDVTGHE